MDSLEQEYFDFELEATHYGFIKGNIREWAGTTLEMIECIGKPIAFKQQDIASDYYDGCSSIGSPIWHWKRTYINFISKERYFEVTKEENFNLRKKYHKMKKKAKRKLVIVLGDDNG